MADNEKTPLLDGQGDTDSKLGFTFRRLMIVPVTLGYFFATGMITYVVTEYVHAKINKDQFSKEHSTKQNWTFDACHSNTSSPDYDSYTHVQKQTAKWLNYFALARAILAIVANLVWGSYSDVVGRKTLLVLCVSGYCVKALGVAIIIHFNAHIAFFLIGEFVDGFVGTYTAFLSVVFAFVADVTEPGNSRTTAIVLFELILGVIFTAATFSTGYFIHAYGYFYPAVTSFGAAFLALCIAICVVPETVAVKKTGGFKRFVSSITTAFNLFFKPETKLKQIKFFLLMSAFIFYTIQLLNRGSLETLYQLGKPFCWSSTKVGIFGAARQGAVSLFGMAILFPLKRILADDTIAVVGSALTIVSYVVEGLAKTEAVLYTVPALGMLAVLPVPMIRSIMSRLTSAEKQGALFASIGAFETLCSLIGALTDNIVYSATLSIMNGFVFLMLAVITAISGSILAVFMCVQRNTEDDSVTNDKLEQEIRVNEPPE